MHTEYDPDDNFDHAFARDAEIDEDAASEALVWQLLLMINPGDEDAALQQFATYREAAAAIAGEPDVAELLREAIDWKAGFFVEDGDPQALVEAIDELAGRWDLRIDWGLDDTEDEPLADADVQGLINTAYDRLREHHYTLWTWEVGHDHYAGWVTRSADDEGLRMVAGALGFHVRAGAG
jgi:hypothetical protein